MSDWERINIWLDSGEPLDDTTARMIAERFHGGQGSALYSFVSTGCVTTDAIVEVRAQIWKDRIDEPINLDSLYPLQAYLQRHKNQPAQPGWNERTSY